jgi:hypothetical protein
MAARTWTDAQKAQQAEVIHRWQPWQSSTGPKTPEGRAKSSRNAYRGYFREHVRLACWLSRSRRRGRRVTPELINEFKRRADKLQLCTDDESESWLPQGRRPVGE